MPDYDSELASVLDLPILFGCVKRIDSLGKVQVQRGAEQVIFPSRHSGLMLKIFFRGGPACPVQRYVGFGLRVQSPFAQP